MNTMNEPTKRLRDALASIMLDARLGPIVAGLDPIACKEALGALDFAAGFYRSHPPISEEVRGFLGAAMADGDVARAGGWRHSERDAHVALNAVFAAGTRPKGFNPLLGSRPAMTEDERLRTDEPCGDCGIPASRCIRSVDSDGRMRCSTCAVKHSHPIAFGIEGPPATPTIADERRMRASDRARSSSPESALNS